MRILLVSKEIYPDDSTGLAIAAKSHYDILKKKGYTIRVVSRNKKKMQILISILKIYFILFLIL